MGRTTAAMAIRATPPHLTIPALLSASGGVISQFLEHTSEVRSRGQAFQRRAEVVAKEYARRRSGDSK